MNEQQQKYYKKQKAKRTDEQIQRFRDFGVLTEPDLQKIREKEPWLLEYLKHHNHITLANLTGDFMLSEWEINLKGRNDGHYGTEMRRILIYSFRPIIQRLAKEGKLVKVNSKTYKVVKE